MVSASFSFVAPPAAVRFRAAVNMLRTPRGYVPVLVIAAFPPVLCLVSNLLAPGGSGLFPLALVSGVLAGLLVLLLVVTVPVLRRIPSSVLTFDDDGIRETVAGATTELGWSWVVAVIDDDPMVMISCGPSKSGRLERDKPSRNLVLAKSDPRLVGLRELFEKHTRFRL